MSKAPRNPRETLTPKLLNLGCGTRSSPDSVWTNVDFQSFSNWVIAHDLNQGIPFADETFDAVYHSHLLEHFTAKDGVRFVGECFRALKKRGILRVVVPDLEQICRLYLESLQRAEAGDQSWHSKYDWIKLEMYDQCVRTTTGGAMAEYLGRADLPDKEFVISRAGSVARELIETAGRNKPDTAREQRPFWRRGLSKLRRTPRKISHMIRTSLLTRREQEALKLGLFRLGGEVHQWMYDQYSLGKLLEGIGFTDVRRCPADDSAIARWNEYHLDIDPNGFEHAPASLYMEGVKPS